MSESGLTFGEVVGFSLGRASMAWSEAPTGIFDSDTCSELARDIVATHEYELTKLREDNKKLIAALEDFELRVNHAGDCGARFQYGGGCNCMDLNYFSLQSCADRARQALKEIGNGK